MTGDQIRELFLRFFEARGHMRMPSASLIPSGDTSLLFTSAGMVPFKSLFTGEQKPPSALITSSQKCFRTTDVDRVGDPDHLTFFEMLGNFSIGSYFKKEAISWAWDFLTSSGEGLGLSEGRIYVTMLNDDDEVFSCWTTDVGLSKSRIYSYGENHNWWGPAGTEGPCGSCSEVHYDWGHEAGCGKPLRNESQKDDDCHPNHGCGRFIELWNLVFLQYYQNPLGGRKELQIKGVDTGLGLERAVVILQGVQNVYETDLFSPIVKEVLELAKIDVQRDAISDYSLRVISEHIRAVTFLISDGVVPSNDGRGYVLRRIIRRFVRHGTYIGLKEHFWQAVIDVIIKLSEKSYPEMSLSYDFIIDVLKLEERRFKDTFDRGARILKGMVDFRDHRKDQANDLTDSFSNRGVAESDIQDLLEEYGFNRFDGYSDNHELLGHQMAQQSVSLLIHKIVTSVDAEIELKLEEFKNWFNQLSGPEAFLLWDTYGFPIEETVAIVKQYGIDVDLDGFNTELENQKDQARFAHGFSGAMETSSKYTNLVVEPVRFIGYEDVRKRTKISALIFNDSEVKVVSKGQKVEVVLSDTPFYPSGGGQIGDSGSVISSDSSICVNDTYSPMSGLIVHSGVVQEGEMRIGETVDAHVDFIRRADVARNHSGTHILHSSLRTIIGTHVRQAGSFISADRIRFDYTHINTLSTDEIAKVQELANRNVMANLGIRTNITTYDNAIRDGAIAFFGERYGQDVRVVSMAKNNDETPFSMEVCGGTHVAFTGEIGMMFIIGESGIGGGVRRIEALTGAKAEQLFVDRGELIRRIANRLDVSQHDLEGRLETFLTESLMLKKQITKLQRQSMLSEAEGILAQAKEIKGIHLVAANTSLSKPEYLREMADWLMSKLNSGVIVLSLIQKGRPMLIAMVSKDLVKRGFHADRIINEVAYVLDGRGGGNAELAQAGGKNVEKLNEALLMTPKILRKLIGK